MLPIRSVRAHFARPPSALDGFGPLRALQDLRMVDLVDRRINRSTTTVALLIKGSDLLPDSRERMDERRVDRGSIGTVGGIVAGGEGADTPVVHAGPGSGIGGSVS